MECLKKSLVFGFLVVFGFVGGALSDEPVPQAKMELRRVTLFKNGLGFFVAEVTIPGKTKSFYVIPEAAASHGTFWVSYPPKVEVENVVFKEVEYEKLVEATGIVDLLRPNTEKQVKVYLGNKSVIEGKLLRVISRPLDKPPNLYAPGSIDYGDRSHYPASDMVLLQTDQGQVAVGADTIVRVDFPDAAPETKYEQKTKQVRMDVALKKAASGKLLTVSCLAKGATWAPSYMIDITEPNRATIAAKAEIINEVWDLDGVEVQLVTGYPNLQFADVLSPTAMKGNLAQFLQSLMRGQSPHGAVGGVLSNVMMQRAEVSLSAERRIMPMYGAAEVGKTAEDLFLYPLKKVHLDKGEVGYFPLFSEPVPFKHIYRWEIPDYVNAESGYYDQRSQMQTEPQQEVWHCIRLENVTKLPWTTAPAEIIKEGVILGQDILDYTPLGDKGTVKITRAMSVKAEQVELETDRKRDAAQWYGYHYDLVTVQGKLSVTNFQDKPITLEVTKTLSGEVKLMQPEAKVEKLAKALRAVNSNVRLTWTVKLAAGENREIVYNYEVYVRR